MPLCIKTSQEMVFVSKEQFFALTVGRGRIWSNVSLGMKDGEREIQLGRIWISNFVSMGASDRNRSGWEKCVDSS